jgi:hypothetical protein
MPNDLGKLTSLAILFILTAIFDSTLSSATEPILTSPVKLVLYVGSVAGFIYSIKSMRN